MVLRCSCKPCPTRYWKIFRAADKTPLASLSRLVVLFVLPAAERPARAASLSFVSRSEAPAADSHAAHHTAAANEQQADLSEGEVTRVDAAALKVTLRHGELKNLNMPPMTMVFRVQDAAQLAPLKAGDKVRFRAEQVKGAYYATRIEKAQ